MQTAAFHPICYHINWVYVSSFPRFQFCNCSLLDDKYEFQRFLVSILYSLAGNSRQHRIRIGYDRKTLNHSLLTITFCRSAMRCCCTKRSDSRSNTKPCGLGMIIDQPPIPFADRNIQNQPLLLAGGLLQPRDAIPNFLLWVMQISHYRLIGALIAQDIFSGVNLTCGGTLLLVAHKCTLL